MTSIIDVAKGSAARALKISLTGISFGALAGLAALLARGGVSGVASVVGALYWGLALLPTATLSVMVMNDLQSSAGAMYRSAPRAVGLFLLWNVAGAALAIFFYYVLATSTPGVLRRLDLGALRQAVAQSVGWIGVAGVLAAAVLGALLVAVWARRRVQG